MTMAKLTKRIHVRSEGDITRAIVETSQVARSLGFDAPAVNKIATATSELARNIIKYAGTGEILIRQAGNGGGIGIEIAARDRGPGIADVDTAMQDHYSSSGTLGLGLPGVRRMMDDFEIETEVDRGTTVTIRAWRTRPSPRLHRSVADTAARAEGERRFEERDHQRGRTVDVGPEVDCAYVIRPCRGELVSGDEVYVERRDDHLVVALIDALGHGPSASRAARLAKTVLRESRKASVMTLMQALHEALAATVGAAASICEIDLATRTGQYCAVGNTVGRILGKRDLRLHATAGVLGSNLRPPRQDRFHLEPGELLVMYSDGISDRFVMNDYPQIGYQHARTIVASLLARFGKPHDDASCVVVRSLS
ncbi:MAG: ATP-binding SpoIIE family protein phosphatase [Planctomycetota bacterium]|jgi:anti-sigma regulatory factor (Ser/Thr protein kinase)